MPNDEFVELISKIEIIFQEQFESAITKPNICASYLELCNRLPFTHPCKNFPKDFVIRLYLRVRIYFTIKRINENFRKINKNKLIIWRNH